MNNIISWYQWSWSLLYSASDETWWDGKTTAVPATTNQRPALPALTNQRLWPSPGHKLQVSGDRLPIMTCVQCLCCDPPCSHQILIDLFIWMLIIVFPVYCRYQRHQTLAAMITGIIIPGLSWSCGGSPADTNTRHHQTFICRETEGDINLNVLFTIQDISLIILMHIFLPCLITMVIFVRLLLLLKLNKITGA